MVSVQDVRIAFDSMRHGLVSDSLRGRGVSSRDVGTHMRELTALAGYITLPFVAHTPPFNFFKGVNQGGVETPDEWRAIIDQIMEPIVLSWCQRGLGFTLYMTESALRLINHAVWADNIVLFAADYTMMQCMILELNEAFGTFCNPDGHRYFQLKPDSLEYIVSDPSKS